MTGRCHLLALLLLAAAPGLADGMFAGRSGAPLTGRAGASGLVSSAAQKAVVIRDGSHEVLLLQTTYAGPAAGFAWVVPLPSRPARGDIFLASPRFLDQALRLTQPRVTTRLSNPWEEALSLPSLGLAARRPDAPPAARVQVWERVLVGDFEATVLTATEGVPLVSWLRSSGYAVPRLLAQVADGYARRGWCFVALRISPQRVPAGRLLHSVQPLGLRFPATRLTYPLAISRVSAPDRTALLLVVCDRTPVQTQELPETRLPTWTDLPPGATYASFVRQVLQRRPWTLLVEARLALADRLDERAVDDFTRGRYREEPRGAALAGWPPSAATRFYGLLPRPAMVDLTFAPAPAGDTFVTVTREGAIYYGGVRGLVVRRWPLALAVLLLGAPAWLWQRRRPAPAPTTEAARVVRRRAGRGCLLLVLIPLACCLAPPLWVLPLVLLALWPLVLVAVVALLVTLLWAGHPQRRLLTLWVTLVVAAPTCVPPVVGLYVVDSGRADAEQRLEAGLRRLEAGLEGFVTRHGCYPATLSDLLQADPRHGLDASGNQVAIAPLPQPRPVLTELPVDPLTGRRGTWTYDVLAPGLVDSGGYRVTVQYLQQTPAAAGRREAEAPQAPQGSG